MRNALRKTRAHSTLLFKKANFFPVDLLYKHQICLVAHAHAYAHAHYNQTHPDPTYPTGSSKIKLLLPSTSACSHRQPEAWNKLPVQIRIYWLH